MMNNYLSHYGTKRHSGRYPWGSGQRPFQRDGLSRTSSEILSKELKKKKQITESYGVKYRKRSNKVDLDEEIELKRGQKVQHVSGIDFDNIRKGNLYVTYDQYDNVLYKSLLGGKLRNAGYDPKIVSLELSKDLKAPSSNRQFEMYKAYKQSNKKEYDEHMNKFYSNKGKARSLDEKDEYIDFTESLETSSKAQKAFLQFSKEGRV